MIVKVELDSFQEEGEDKKEFNRMGSRGKNFWRALTHAVMWCIWDERNRRSFDNKFVRTEAIRERILECTFSWILSSDHFKGFRYADLARTKEFNRDYTVLHC
uniref:Uncharacterized protein n=1 Tax=Nelumbo nucifera TaxID=4432 RepID=A0A822XSD1_NELNU|nr:TPA_asm: hypothetical protein HUJ06_024375 [Nelumbo nucifera]